MSLKNIFFNDSLFAILLKDSYYIQKLSLRNILNTEMNLKVEGLCEDILMCIDITYTIRFCFEKQTKHGSWMYLITITIWSPKKSY